MLTRRQVLTRSAAVGGLAFAGVLPGLRAAAQATVPLRRSLQGMDLDDPVLATLRAFVTMMKDPSRDGQPVSWVGFSDVHGDASAFNRCPHGNWYFLPWHRGYLRMYESAVRSLTGDAGFAMPYWDWTAQPDFPAAFGDPTFDGQPNPLHVPGRLMATGDAIDPSVSGQPVMDVVFAAQTFEEFGTTRATGQNSTDPIWIRRRGISGELESNPHDNVHCDVRGPFMCSGASPQDPIFQMHHCNIDRIWAQWNFNGGLSSSDPLWLNMPFTDHFIAPDGTSYTDVVSQLLEVEPLGYTYGIGAPEEPPIYDPARVMLLAELVTAPAALARTGMARSVVDTGGAVAEPQAPLDVTLAPEGRSLAATVGAGEAAAAFRSAGLGTPTVIAIVRGLAPAEGEGTQLRVFVNAPDATAATPTVDNPNFVTSIGFFGPIGAHAEHGGGAEDMRKAVLLDLTPALRRLGATGDAVELRFVPVAQREGDTPGAVTVEGVELAIL